MRLPIPGPMLKVLLSACVLFAAPLHGSPEPLVRDVKIEGNLRVPSATILRQISLAADRPFDPAAAQKDLRRLQSLGTFEYIAIDTRAAGEDRVDAIVRVRELPFVSAFVIEGVSSGLEERIHEYLRSEKLEIKSSRPYQPASAQKAARGARGFLQARSYPQASVQVQEERRGALVRVVFKVQTGPRLRIGEVRFLGNLSLPEDELRKEMQHTRAARFWNRMTQAGTFTPEKLASDLEHVRRYYQSRGYAAVNLGPPAVEIRKSASKRWLPLPFGSRERDQLVIRIPVEEGPRFKLASVRVEGDTKSAADVILPLTGAIQAPRGYDGALLDETRRKIVSALGRAGYALAQVRLDQKPVEGIDAIEAVYNIDAGEPVEVGAIRFEGNSRLPEKFLRRELVAQEAEVFDSSRLDKSIDRLNRSGMVRDIQRSDVALNLDPERNALDITFKVKEKDRQGLFATGGTGGIGGGYLGIVYTAFNFLGLGEMLSLELDGGAAQSNILLNLAARRFLGSPFALALSGFHRYTNLNIASITPGPADLLSVFRRRSAGFGLGGAYTVTSKSQLGLGYQLERGSVSGSEEVGTGLNVDPRIIRGELSPMFVFDSTKDSGPAMRGTRFVLSHTLTGSALLGNVQFDRPFLAYGRYLDDPWTGGKNAFAFKLQGGTIQARGENTLPMDLRYFPGSEMVRGFRRGSLSPWAYVPASGPESLRPAGADTALGFSAEYRVPVRGALSGDAFVDLGWTRLGKLGSIDNPDKGAQLLEASNRLLRASLGGELRLQLPIIREPARMIFAWNPLRLDRIVEGASSHVRLADPRGAIRFALGNIF